MMINVRVLFDGQSPAIRLLRQRGDIGAADGVRSLATHGAHKVTLSKMASRSFGIKSHILDFPAASGMIFNTQTKSLLMTRL